MTPEQTFLAAICAAPDDLTPRLIFADWLEERGQRGDAERAEFVRVQCELAKLPTFQEAKRLVEHGSDPLVISQKRLLALGLERRERELLGSPYGISGVLIVRQPPPEWAGGVRDILPWDRDSWTFRRGFVEEIELRIDEWVARGRELRAAAPLRVVRLTCEPATFENSVNLSFWQVMHKVLVRLAQDDEPGDNPVCGLDTLDLSRLIMGHRELNVCMDQAYRPWRGLRHLILPNWSDLPEHYRPHEIEQWKRRVPSLETVQFGTTAPKEEATA